MRRKYTATMRQTAVLELPTQLRHGFHLFFVICSAVIARNVANQDVLEAFDANEIMGKLYLSVAVVAGLVIGLAGWFGRNHDTRRVARIVHTVVAVCMAGSFLVPDHLAHLTIVKYLLMEVGFASMLLVFGMMLGASLGPREARKLAGRVGSGGIVGGLAGNLLCMGAPWFGSDPLYLAAAALALAPVFFLPATSSPRRGVQRIELARERSSVPALAPYGRWVAITTFLMVAATTLIDYQYRYGADAHYSSDAMTAFFGFVGILGGCATVLFQLTALDRLLDRLGLFGTATVMPGALIICSAAFGLVPSLTTLVVLKVVDSGSNMSLQQATGNLLLAPLSPRARAVWQGRIDGFAKRGSQLVAGSFLVLFPWTPSRVLPVALLVCALWVGAIMFTRTRYVRLLTEMLGDSGPEGKELEVYDGGTLKLLETELARAAPPRAAVILDLLERAGHRAPDHLLARQIKKDPHGAGALRVIEHLTSSGDVQALILHARDDDNDTLARTALIALADLEPRVAQHRSRQILSGGEHPEPLRAIAAGILAELDAQAKQLARKMSRSSDPDTRLGVVQALGRASPASTAELGAILHVLANDAEAEVARTAIEAIGSHPSSEGAEVTLRALQRREVRGAAMRALAAMGQPVVPRVAQELRRQCRTPKVASTLTWILGRIGSSEGVHALVDALDTPIVKVRLNAAVALSTLHRRRPDFELPFDAIAARYLPEIRFYARMREASLADLPDTAAGKLLLRTLKQRAQSSLETLFRVMSLNHPEDAMQGAFQAISSRDPRKRQIALELLDTLVDKPVAEAISEAVGGVRARSRRSRRDDTEVLAQLARDPDRFLASLANAARLDTDTGADDRRGRTETTGEIMAQTVVNQILELQSLTLFSQSSAEDLAEVASMVSARRVGRDTVLFREDEAADAMYLVRTGEITLSRKGQILDHIGPGEACGIVAILDQLPREYTATASMDSKLLVIRGDDLLQLLADRPLLMHSVFRALTAALRSQLERGALGKKAEEWSW